MSLLMFDARKPFKVTTPAADLWPAGGNISIDHILSDQVGFAAFTVRMHWRQTRVPKYTCTITVALSV